MSAFAILHIPHSSTVVPPAARSGLSVTDAALAHEILHLTDHFTDEIYSIDDPLAVQLVYPVSRLVVDPERFTDDEKESMAAHGMGVVYTRTLDGAPLRATLAASDRRALIETYYEPHHARLTALVDEAVTAHGAALVLDGHSYPSRPHPFEDASRPRPEVCLGTDGFHTPEWLFEEAARLCRGAGFSVDRDQPFAGAIVPSKRYSTDRSVLSLMLELRRDTYVDEESGAKRPQFDEVRARMQTIVRAIVRTAFERTRWSDAPERGAAFVRPEAPEDAAAIHAVHAASFPTDAEARLVDLLRAAGHLSVSLVAEAGGEVVGHVAFSPVTAGAGAAGAGLGPVAVVESHRRQGIAAELIRAGLETCRRLGFEWAVVLGDPKYYSRFGFGPASDSGLRDEYDGGSAFQAMELTPGALPAGAGLVRYAPEFALVS